VQLERQRLRVGVRRGLRDAVGCGDSVDAIYPGVAIGILVFSFNLFGDALRDVLDPPPSRQPLAGFV